MIKVLHDRSELAEFKLIWNEIFEKDPNVTPFQKYEYIDAALVYMSHDNFNLYTILIKDDPTNKWIAIFPFVLDKNNKLRFINARHTDFCAPLIIPQHNNYNLYKEISDYILTNKEIEGIALENVAQTSPLLAVFKPYFRYMITHEMNYYSSIPIYASETDSDSIDAFRYVHSKQRKNLRKTKNRISTECEFRILSASQGDPYPENEISTLINTMLDNGIRAREYFSDKMLSFWRRLYSENVLSIAILTDKTQALSCNFMFYDKKHNEYIKWIMLYKESSWNMAINILIADHIYTDKSHGNINFARGIYDYKLTNFHPDVKPLFCVKIAKTRWGHFKNIVSTAIHYSKPIVKSFLGR